MEGNIGIRIEEIVESKQRAPINWLPPHLPTPPWLQASKFRDDHPVDGDHLVDDDDQSKMMIQSMMMISLMMISSNKAHTCQSILPSLDSGVNHKDQSCGALVVVPTLFQSR